MRLQGMQFYCVFPLGHTVACKAIYHVKLVPVVYKINLFLTTLVKTGLQKSMFHLLYRYKMSANNNRNFMSECTIESIHYEFGSNQVWCFHLLNWNSKYTFIQPFFLVSCVF